MWKKIELEWKILIIGMAFFCAVALPGQHYFVNRLSHTLEQSIDPTLDPLLRSYLAKEQGPRVDTLITAIERTRQWEAMVPILVREQRSTVYGFTITLFVIFSLVALYTLKRLTQPLKNLAGVVSRIGKGESVVVPVLSGGALGTLEKAVGDLQSELSALRDQAQAKGMEKAWQDIARIMAHEIKNPLTPIRLTLDRIEERIALKETFKPEELATFLGRINGQIDALERLVNQFRSFAREPEATPRMLNGLEFVTSCTDPIASSVAISIMGDVRIYADPYLLSQALLNIINNSIEAGATALIIRLTQVGEKAQIILRDNGAGIPSDKVGQIWLPYVTFKKNGTGLGLPVVKRLVESMQGTVTLLSNTNGNERGVTVRIALPTQEYTPL